MAEMPSRARAIVGAALASVALAAVVWSFYDTTDTRIFYFSALVAAPLGLALLYVMARVGPLKEVVSKAPTMLAWGLATLSCACLLYSGSMIVNGLGGGPREPLACDYMVRAGTQIRYRCSVPGGGTVQGRLRMERLPDGLHTFMMDGRRGSLGIWLVDPRSIRAAPR